MTQIVDERLKKICNKCESHLDRPCAWLSLGNEYCDDIMNIQKKIDELDANLYSANQVISDLIDVHTENERLKEENEMLEINKVVNIANYVKDMADYKSRCEKALEYLEKEKSNYMRCCDLSNITNREGLIISSAIRTCTDTLNILNGKE